MWPGTASKCRLTAMRAERRVERPISSEETEKSLKERMQSALGSAGVGLMIRKGMGEASRGLVMVYFLLWVMVTWIVIL